MSDHSILSPSSAGMWMRCPGSLAAGKGIPRITSAFADEGTIAHAVAEKCLRENIDATYALSSVPGANSDMIEPVMVYVKAVRRMLKGATWQSYEEKLDLSGILGYPEQVGTADAIGLTKTTLQVHDLKYGKGIRVSAVENPQEMLYGLGALSIALLITDNIKKVKLVIHQPRLSDEPSEYTLSVAELKIFGDKAKAAAAKAMQLYETGDIKDSDFNPGKEQCQWCPVKGTCKYLAKSCTNEVLGEFDDLTAPKVPDVATMTPEQIARVLSVEDLILDWLKAVDKRALESCLKGEKIPGWKLVNGRMGNRAWADEKKIEETFKGYRLTHEEMYDMKLISPTQAEKVLSKKRWEEVEKLVTRKPASKQMVPITDSRPEVVPENIESEFDNLNKEG